MRTRAISAATLFALAGTAQAQFIDWNNPAGGSWNNAANWSGGNIPDASTETAIINEPGSYSVTLDNSILSLGSLSLLNPDVTLEMILGRSLGVDSGIVNNGLIIVNSTAGGASTTVQFDDPGSTLTGTGTLRLNGFSSRAQMITSIGADLTHGAGHTIEGFGRMNAVMQNDGVIDANVAGQQIDLVTGQILNTNIMRATNGGTMSIGPLTLLQNPTGRLVADGGTVRIGGVALVGGTIETLPGGLTQVGLASTFDAVTIEGPLEIELGDSITVTNGLTNNSDLLVNNNAGGAVTTLQFDDSSTLGGTGTVILNGFGSRSQIITTDPEVLLHAGSHTIRGFGLIEGTMINAGTINGDTAGQEIAINNSTITNTGTINAVGVGEIDINNTLITQTAGGKLVADAGTLNMGGLTLNGGEVEVINDGVAEIDLSSDFDAVTLNGDVILDLGDTLNVTNGLTNNGTLLINDSAGGAATTLIFNDSSTLDGAGIVQLNGFGVRSQILTAAGQTFTHADTHTIRGFGLITASMVNHGPIIADNPTQEIDIDNSDIQNTADISAFAGGTVDFDGTTVTNSGTGRILADGGTVLIGTSSINGGVIETTPSGTTVVNGSSAFDAVRLEGQTIIEVGDTIAVTNGLLNNGPLIVNNNGGGATTELRFDDSSTLAGSGTVALNGFSTRASLASNGPGITVTQGPAHTLAGQGLVAAPLINNGTIAPGFPGSNPIREMLANADITNTDSAVYRVEVTGDVMAGTVESDLIDSSEAYHADGTLVIELIEGYDPPGLWNIAIVEADMGVTGRFDTIVAPAPTDTRLAIRARYLPTEIRIGAVCKADIDFNGVLNFFDITAFIALFNAQDPDADIAAPSGQWNFFDIATYIGQFNAGCP